MLIVDAGHATVAGNHVVMPPGPPPPLGGGPSPVLGEEVRRRLAAALRTGKGPGVRTLDVPGSETPLHVFSGSEALPLVQDFVRTATAAGVRRAGGAEKALGAFGRSIGTGRGRSRLSRGSLDLIADIAGSLRAVLQGIVIGGGSVGVIRVLENIVEDAVQGIHVGVSDGDTPGRESAESVTIARNVVESLVPVNYGRERHAVFVGNARTIHVLDTVAGLRRIGRLVPDARPTPVEGVRVHGELGPFMVVRQSSLRGFTVGVRVTPLNQPAPKNRVWLVAETMAAGASPAVVAPDSVDRERNAP